MFRWRGLLLLLSNFSFLKEPLVLVLTFKKNWEILWVWVWTWLFKFLNMQFWFWHFLKNSRMFGPNSKTMFGSLHTLTFTKDEFGLGAEFCNKLQLKIVKVLNLMTNLNQSPTCKFRWLFKHQIQCAYIKNMNLY